MGGRARIAWVCAALLILAGCGGDDTQTAATPTPTPTATETATPTPTAEAAIEADAVAKMPEVPVGAVGTLPPPASAKVHDPGLLHTAFESAETMWEREFGAAGSRYQHAKLVFFHSTVRTKCGEQSRETGPFYCPADFGIYLNTTFFDGLARKYALQSGFAAGYITAHEVAHHVQELLGVHQRVAAANASDPAGANARSIQVELQADCYAGVWLHTVSARGELTEADVQDIVTAATVVGDDYQRNSAGAELAPETWTHGSSADRVRWVLTGLQQGLPSACNTFAS
ncbi:neutral zinc metallopeptidase [Solirubrobacter ginsenosidimutans]|uniref:Neutral zinc metallopeptidase n=1 Tax=Solirubrobacter ginsenosidimutans TaxID=490573 RepID=A0A9X3MNT6_9ACTN|nr:neutral zinc metallopeptidase [Solirubrobacter ginsenosidimutans]MDA0160041.1 neutral zinc metallopeptidase [Solirubrobacter ginsenosidimutans]